MLKRIGIFDSGIGGMTVLSQLLKKAPPAHYIYFGDTLHVPYGTKSMRQITHLCMTHAFLLKEKKVDFCIVACNTVSSIGLSIMQDILHPIPVIGVIEPLVQSLVPFLRPEKPIIVFATPATIKSHAYQKAFAAYSTQTIYTQSCPLLVPFIEEGWHTHPALHQVIFEYTAFARTLPPGIALLACTHYPWIQHLFKECLPGWEIKDSAESMADKVQSIFPAPSFFLPPPPIEWIFSDPEALCAFAQTQIRFLSSPSFLNENFCPIAI